MHPTIPSLLPNNWHMKPKTRAYPGKLGISDVNKSGGGEYDIVRCSQSLLVSPDNEIGTFNRVAKPVTSASGS